MTFYHIYKTWTAGSNLLLSLLVSLIPFIRLICSCHICPKRNFHKSIKSKCTHRLFPACHRDIWSKLSFRSWSTHRIYILLLVLQCIYDIDDKCLGTNCTKRTAVNTFTTTDTFLIINDRYPILVIRNRVYRTCILTRSFQISNCIIWTCLRTFSTFFTFRSINM